MQRFSAFGFRACRVRGLRPQNPVLAMKAPILRASGLWGLNFRGASGSQAAFHRANGWKSLKGWASQGV